MAKENMTSRIEPELKIKEPNDITYNAMEAAEKDEEMHGPYDTVEDMMKDLNA